MNTLQNKGFKTSVTKILSRMGWMLLVIFVLAAVMFSAQPAQASGRQCPAPGTGLAGALNMLHDPTMFTVAMAHASARGIAGMDIAITHSACP